MTADLRDLPMREAWARTLMEIGAADPRTVLLDADLGTSTRADLFAAAHPERFFQMGIAEAHMVGAAAGMASMGLVPWLSSFGVFLTNRSLDTIRLLVAQCGTNVKLMGCYTGVCFGMAGKTHHDHADLTILRAMPGMTVLAPGDNAECAAMTRWAHEHHGPVYLRTIREAPPPLPGNLPPFAPGKVRVLREGGSLVLVSTGSQTARVLAAADMLSADGITGGVVHLPCIKPLDPASLLEACAGAKEVVTVEDQSVFGGLGGMVAELLAEQPRPVRVRRIGLEDCFVTSGSNDYLLDRYGLSASRVAGRLREFLGRS